MFEIGLLLSINCESNHFILDENTNILKLLIIDKKNVTKEKSRETKRHTGNQPGDVSKSIH